MAVHRKAVALMEPMEAMARLAARAQSRAEAAQTRASGSASYDNGDGTRTVIGPQTGSATMATHVGDVTPPPVPTGIRAWSGDGSLHVLWAGSLAGEVPADFDHVTILVDGRAVAEMRSAGSVTVDGLRAGQTVAVTATAEDDACLADGTPAHNVSAACPAVTVTVRDAIAEVRADADAHGEQIEAVKRDIADYKAAAEATYATNTEVNEKTGAITRTLAADYTRTADLASTEAVRDAKAAGTTAQSQLGSYKSSNDKAVADAKAAGTTAQSQLADYKATNDAAVADAKRAGTDAGSALDAYKGVVTETYAEKTELTEAVNQLSSTMTSNYSAFTDYRETNDAALSKAQSDATNAQSTIDSYKTANDRAVADAKAAGTTAQDQLGAYKSSNDAAVRDAKRAGTDAQSQLGSYKATTDQRLDELKNIADNAIESFYLKGAPTATNQPASSWTTDALRRQHAGDLYMDTDTGYSYRWSGTEWVQVKDSDVTKALKEIESVKTTYATKSELSATDTELSGKVSDALTTAKSYTDGSVAKEATARDAAIKASADSISLDVSRTYTKSDTFSAYQSDADSRIATANSNASTAVSTAKTAASDAATAKTNASSAVSTANSASSSAASAVKTANAASGSAASAVETASSASSTASAASTAASKASTDAAAAVKTANAASSDASSAVKTANGAASTASAASSTASAAKATAEGAASTASSAKGVADSASSTAKAASTSASNAVSTANAAKSTAQAASATASTAKSTADTAKATADDAWSRTLRVQVESSPADAAGDTSTLTATVWRGGERLTEQEVAMMGLVAWYVGGSRVATGYTYSCAAGTAVECRVEG